LFINYYIKMFKKLISNLPFQPALLSDVAFYAHRLKQEQAVRRIGFILILVGFGIQVFAVAFPPQASLATSTGDIVYGATSRQDILTAYKNDRDQLGRTDIQEIFNAYGIGEAQIAKATATTIKDDGTNYINTSRSTTKWADTFVPIQGAIDGGIYEFPLTYWRKAEYPNGYPALTGISTYGFRFWILLKGCGNIVYEKGAKKPQLEITKKLTSGTTVTQGKNSTYTINFRNTGAIASKATKVVDTLPTGLAYLSHKSSIDVSFSKNGQTLTWEVNNKDGALAPSTRWHQITLTVRADIPSTTKKCNVVTIVASNAAKATAKDGTCITVVSQSCPGTGLPIPAGGIDACVIQCPDGSELPYNKTCSTPQLSCSDLEITAGDSWSKRRFETTVTMQSGAAVKEVVFYVNDAKVGSVSPATADQKIYSYTHDFVKEGEYVVKSEVIANTGQVQVSQNCSKNEQITKPETPEAILVTDKFVRNDTKNIDDANNTTAAAGDVLMYTLTIANKGAGDAVNVPLTGEYAEDVSDILEYADITDIGDGILNKESGKISWPAVTITAGSTITKKFTVTVKNPLPATPISLSDPLSFDYEMHNKYGRTVVVKLPKPVSKTVEQTVTVLPNTGPTSTLLISALFVSVIAYFYYRNKLLAKELRIIQREFQTGGM
jgi:uncharacterized repeat protein (TIGR01451 family)